MRRSRFDANMTVLDAYSTLVYDRTRLHDVIPLSPTLMHRIRPIREIIFRKHIFKKNDAEQNIRHKLLVWTSFSLYRHQISSANSNETMLRVRPITSKHRFVTFSIDCLPSSPTGLLDDHLHY